MEVIIVPDAASGASIVVDALAELVGTTPEAVLGLATGSSPEPVYEELARRHRTGQLDLAGIRAFLLDEYVGLPPDHPASYGSVIRAQVVDRLGLDPDRVAGPDGNAPDLAEACRRYEGAITAAGGVDLQLLGIGTDGHIGFNEPGSSLGSRTRLKTLTARTRADNARFFGGDAERVPTHVVTQGVGTTWCWWPGVRKKPLPWPAAWRGR
jgi:glucosamine-6-phosphate deaminase